MLRSVSLLDAFDLELATQVAGLVQQSAALRLSERPFVHEDPFALWPFHLHALVHSTVQNADDHTDDRWSPQDCLHAAQRARTALGAAGRAHTGPRDAGELPAPRPRPGPRLRPLGWLTDAAPGPT